MTDTIPDFSRPRRSAPQFRMEDDVFIGVPALAAMALMETAMKASTLGSNIADESTLRAIDDIFRILLTPESADLFLGRVHGDRAEPIDSAQMNKALMYLMEYHGMRPTEPSSDSAAGSPTPPDGGTNSTATAPTTASTSVNFPPPASSISYTHGSSAA